MSNMLNDDDEQGGEEEREKVTLPITIYIYVRYIIE